MSADKAARMRRLLEHQEQLAAQKKARENELDRGMRAFFEYLQSTDIQSARRVQP